MTISVKIVDILTDTTKHFVLFLTKNGFIKKSNLEEYKNIKRNGTIGVKLREGDEVQKICGILRHWPLDGETVGANRRPLLGSSQLRVGSEPPDKLTIIHVFSFL